MRSRILVASVFAAGSVFGAFEWDAAAATNFNVTANAAMTAYVINGANNPTLTLTKGQTYTFTIVNEGMFHPFFITKVFHSTATADLFNDGLLGGSASQGSYGVVMTLTVPSSAPATLFYQCGIHDPMSGQLNIVPAAAAPSISTTALAALAGLLMLVATRCLRKRAQA